MKLAASTSLFVVTFASLLLSIAGSAPKQLQTLPGSVVQGKQILTSAGCLNCHSIDGKGGTRGPDLSVPSRTAATPALFVESLWNHMPSMLAEIEASKLATPSLKPTEAGDLFAYFYSTLYFSPRGSASRGAGIFGEKQCSNCHSEILNT